MSRLNVDFAGVRFKNPVALASGTCGFGRELDEYFDIARLGGLCSKGLTLLPRGGNDGVRVWETESGIMNSVGLENPGVDAYLERELPWIQGRDIVNIVNLSGHSLEDYLGGLHKLNGADIDVVELNISCPNVKAGGMNFGVKTEVAREVVRAARAACRHKMVVKLSPNAEDIVALSRMCEEEGADGISLINTLLGMVIDVDRRTAVFDNTYAGLSGPAVMPVALRMVHQVCKAVTIPVMGMGGITTWRDALSFIMAGATVVQVGTASFMKPTAAVEIIDGLDAWMAQNGVADLSEVRGVV